MNFKLLGYIQELSRLGVLQVVCDGYLILVTIHEKHIFLALSTYMVVAIFTVINITHNVHYTYFKFSVDCT